MESAREQLKVDLHSTEEIVKDFTLFWGMLKNAPM